MLGNIELIEGNFDSTLSIALEKLKSPDLIFFDGNHRLEPTLRYFELCLQHLNLNSIFIFDDIHWSEEMERTWESIKRNSRVSCTVDLFFIGLVFFRDSFKERQHFVVRF
jgi:predicted O-methyltransferase YrrM